MPSFNRVLLIGTLPRDTETTRTADGRTALRFTVRTIREWTGRDGARHQATEWHDVVYASRPREPTAETLFPYLIRGKLVHVEGSIGTRGHRGGDRDTIQTVINATAVRLLTGSQPTDENRGERPEVRAQDHADRRRPPTNGTRGSGSVDEAE